MVSISKHGWLMLPPKFSCGYYQKLPDEIERVYLPIDCYLDFSFDGIDEFPRELIPPVVPSQKWPLRFASTLNNVLFQLMQVAVCSQYLGGEIGLVIPFDKKKYSGRGAIQRFGAGYRQMTLSYEAVVALRYYWVKTGLIEFHKGTKPDGRNTGYESYILPTQKLVPILLRLFDVLQSNPESLKRRMTSTRGSSTLQDALLVIKSSCSEKRVLYPNRLDDHGLGDLGPLENIRDQEDAVRRINEASSHFDYAVPIETDKMSGKTDTNAKENEGEKGDGRRGERREEEGRQRRRAPYYASFYSVSLPSPWFVYQRIRHDDYQSSGRFYAPFQSLIRSECRRALLINGKPTVELDFGNFHAMMLYHKEKADPLAILRTKGFTVKPGGWVDLYEIPGSLASRDIKKVALTIAIYSRSYKEAIEALKRAIESRIFRLKGSPRFKYDDDRWYLINEPHREPTPEELLAVTRLSHLDPTTVMAHVIDAHSAIQHHFFKGSDTWKDLQSIDSQIAELVMSHFLSKGRPCCGIHDSFIVWQEDEAELREIMIKTYQHVIDTQFKPNIKTINHQSSAEVANF